MSAVHLYSGHVRQAIDEDYTVFLGIESETDHLPVGDVRRHWSAEALAQKDVEIEAAEAFFRERALNAARGVIARYERA